MQTKTRCFLPRLIADLTPLDVPAVLFLPCRVDRGLDCDPEATLTCPGDLVVLYYVGGGWALLNLAIVAVVYLPFSTLRQPWSKVSTQY